MTEDTMQIIMRLRELTRYNVGEFDDGGGYMCSYANEDDTGDWIRASDIDDLISSLGGYHANQN